MRGAGQPSRISTGADVRNYGDDDYTVFLGDQPEPRLLVR
jgi:hypothetical protein